MAFHTIIKARRKPAAVVGHAGKIPFPAWQALHRQDSEDGAISLTVLAPQGCLQETVHQVPRVGAFTAFPTFHRLRMLLP